MASPLYLVGMKTQVYYLDQPIVDLIDRCEKEGYQGNWNELINEINKMLPLARGRENVLYYHLAKLYLYQGKFDLALEITEKLGKENLTLKFRFLRAHILIGLCKIHAEKVDEVFLSSKKEIIEEKTFLERAAYDKEYNISHENFDNEVLFLQAIILIGQKEEIEGCLKLTEIIKSGPSKEAHSQFIYNMSKIALARVHCCEGNASFADIILHDIDIQNFAKVELQYLLLAANYGVNCENRYQSAVRGYQRAQILGAQVELELFDKIIKRNK